MPISTNYKRALLRTLYDDAYDNNQTLLAKLSELRRARINTTSNGAVIVATSANGHSVQLDVGRCTPQDIAAFASQLEDIYADALAALVAAGTASPTDAEIRDQMLTIIGRGYRSIRPDFSTSDQYAYGS